MKGLISEGDDPAGEDYDHDGLRDAAIIGAGQRVEHYEIAAYGTAIARARLLELDDVVSLEETLEEEKAADKKLSEVAAASGAADQREGSGVGRSEKRAIPPGV
jgi:ferritin-like metal-binding protein YciE